MAIVQGYPDGGSVTNVMDRPLLEAYGQATECEVI